MSNVARGILERLARGETVPSAEAIAALENMRGKCGRGGCSAQQKARNNERDRILRMAASTLAPVSSIEAQAKAIIARNIRYERIWRRDHEANRPPADPVDLVFFQLKARGIRVPKLRRLKSILVTDEQCPHKKHRQFKNPV